jgi:hypothetical protein
MAIACARADDDQRPSALVDRSLKFEPIFSVAVGSTFFQAAAIADPLLPHEYFSMRKGAPVIVGNRSVDLKLVVGHPALRII